MLLKNVYVHKGRWCEIPYQWITREKYECTYTVQGGMVAQG